MTDLVQTWFAYLCGQNRCFIIDGATLPLCQRCLGLYAAAAITGTYLLITKAYCQGTPKRGNICIHAIMLLTAMLGGLHVLDPGPAWRLLCGLWTGHVAITWLLTGSVTLLGYSSNSRLSLREESPRPPNHSHAVSVIMSPIIYALAAVIFASTNPPGFWLWTALAGAGAIISIAAVCVGAIALMIRLLRPRLLPQLNAHRWP